MIRSTKALLVAAGAIATTRIAVAQVPPPGQPAPVPPPGPTPRTPPAPGTQPAPVPGTQPTPPGTPPPPGTQPPTGTEPVPPPGTEPTPPPVSEPVAPPVSEPVLPAVPTAPEPEPVPPLVLARGKILIAGSTINFNLSSGAISQPISLAPSVWYGVDDKLTIGVTHDGGTTPWTPRPRFRTITTFDGIDNRLVKTGGPGICLTGEDNGCSGIYDNVGVDGLYALRNDRLGLAAHPALDAGSFDPFLLQLRLGLFGRYQVSERVMLAFDPRLRFGITERDSNKELIDLPIWLWCAFSPELSGYIHTGLSGELTSFGDTYAVPLQVGVDYKLGQQLTLGLDFAFTGVLAGEFTREFRPEGEGDRDGLGGRVLGLRVAYAL